MRIGTVSEIKPRECRVGLTPSGAKAFVGRGHEVIVQRGAGENSGFPDEQYLKAGARLVASAQEVFASSQMVVKVKEPLPEEYRFLLPGQTLFTYLHLAASCELTQELLKRQVKAIAYETIEMEDGSLPCLRPMSEIAGRLSVQEGAKYLEKTYGGRGVLLGGVPGVRRGKVAIFGAGVVGTNACKMAVGLGAEVTVLDLRADRLAYLDDIFGSRITTLHSTEANVEQTLCESDLVIGAVLVPGAKAPRIVRQEHLRLMKPGSVIVDVAVDQGGCVETTRPTTHDDPVFVIDNVVHYCVANMPGAVALTSTEALTSTTIRYGLLIAEMGLEKACLKNKALQRGLNSYGGCCTNSAVAEAFGLNFVNPEKLLN